MVESEPNDDLEVVGRAYSSVGGNDLLPPYEVNYVAQATSSLS